MEAFWTDGERADRGRAAAYFRALAGRAPAEAIATPAEVWRDLAGAPGAGAGAPGRVGLLGGRVAIIDEAARLDPKLGRGLLAWREASSPPGRPEKAAYHLGCLAGTADHVLEAAVRTARDRGAFSSSLMGCREVQESLAGLVSGAELMRLGACRLCRLLDRGDGDRAEAESARLLAGARALDGDVRAVASSLLGAAWVAANLPGDGTGPPDERTPS